MAGPRKSVGRRPAPEAVVHASPSVAAKARRAETPSGQAVQPVIRRDVVPVWSAQLGEVAARRSTKATRARTDPVDNVANLRVRVESVGNSMIRAWRPLLQKVVGSPTIRERDLVSLIDADRTTIGRVVRAVRADDPLMAVHLAPSSAGLELFLAGVGKRASPAELADAQRSIRLLASLLEDVPGGRLGLETLMASWLPESQRRTARTSRQASFRAMASLMGYEAEATSATMFLAPSADGRACDALHVLGRFGFQRLRLGTRVSLFGMKATDEPRAARSVEPVESSADAADRGARTDPSRYFVPEFCRGESRLEAVARSGDELLVCLPGDSPTPGELVDVVYAQVVRRQYQRVSGPSADVSWYEAMPRVPTSVAVIDVYLHRSLWSGAMPLLTSCLAGPREIERPRTLAEVPNLTTQWPDFVQPDDAVEPLFSAVSPSPGLVGHRAIPGYERLLGSCLQRMKWNAADFIGFRVALKHPVIGMRYSLWFDLSPLND